MVTCHRKTIALLVMTLFITQIICSVTASSTSAVSFRGGGVTIDLTYPEEAHPAEISHNLTITTNTNVEVQNITLFIYAPVNSTLEFINKSTIILPPLPADQNFTFVIWFTPPQNTNGTLYCLFYVQTDQAASYLSYIFYTTHVSNLTFTEMQSLYDQILTNYTALLNEYNDLVGNYSNLLANYTNLFSNNTILQDKYDEQFAIYKSLQDSNNDLTNQFNTLNSNYQSKTADYNSLQTDYQTLNSTRNALQNSYNDLQDAYNNLDQAYNELQAQEATKQSSENDVNNLTTIIIILAIVIAALASLTIYIKQKSKEPYIVIHKESPIKNLDEDEEQNGTDTQ